MRRAAGVAARQISITVSFSAFSGREINDVKIDNRYR
jgi:hypothetical protein